MKVPLTYLTQAVHDELSEKIETNLDSYLEDGFHSRASYPGWGVTTGQEIDTDFFLLLNPERSAASDCENSVTVYQNLQFLSPAQACDSRLWTRLTHVEGFEYCRARWLEHGKKETSIRNIETHFFAKGREGLRNDNSISRLWWNYYIARLCRPENPESALQLLLSTSDIRTSTIERPWIAFRIPLLSGILRTMETNQFLRDDRYKFRNFMKAVNQTGGGIVFEKMSEQSIDCFLASCLRG